MDANSERDKEKKQTELRGGGDDREESVGGPTCWKTKGSEDERTAGERERRGEERMREEDAARLKCLLM